MSAKMMPFPSEWVSWHCIERPAVRQWREAVPYLLEEQLAQPIDTIHWMAANESCSADACWVAVVDQAMWQQWLASNAVGRAQLVCPDALLIPFVNEGEITAVIDGDRVRLRWGAWQSAAGDVPTMTVVLEKLLSDYEGIHLFANQVPDAWQGWLLSHQHLAALPMVNSSFSLQAPAAWWHGLQSSVLQMWRAPLLLLVAVCVVSLLLWITETQQLAEQNRQLQQATQAVFKQAFPETKRIVNPVAQARSLLKARLQNQQTQADAMAAVQMAQTLVQGLPNVQQMQWSATGLQLRWSQPIAEAVRQSVAHKAAQPWQWRWVNEQQAELRWSQP